MSKVDNIIKIAKELELKVSQVEATVKLFDEGCTVPFISRYRKEATGNLDEVQVISIRDRLEQLEALDERRVAILKSMREQEVLTEELEKAINKAEKLSTLEDIYLPYKPKRETRGVKAKKKGLEPLANLILEQDDVDLEKEALKYVNSESCSDKKLVVESVEDALQGARDIIAEIVNEDKDVRNSMRELFEDYSEIISTVVAKNKDEKDAQKYRDYFDWKELAKNAPSHRVLAIRRGSDEGFLSFRILPEEESALDILISKYVKSSNRCSEEVRLACEDCYKRLLSLSMETEMRNKIKKRADEKAISVFADNLRELLLASPMGQKVLLGVDPGLRTGCKIVVLDKQGSLLYHSAIYPLEPKNDVLGASKEIEMLVKKYKIESVAVGNGTGGREAEAFCKSLSCLNGTIISMVNEAGASVYSASEIAREEFGEYDLTVRGAVSIGRRLMDPLAELVKIDPKSIGVGQYQHDVDQKQLKKSLDDTVISCVNSVGVEVNTASSKLLSYVSGFSERIANNFVAYRDKNGAFRNREEFKKVVGLGDKVFEQSAGFLRIRGGDNPLDASAVHPESYYIVEKMAKDRSCSVEDLIKDRSKRTTIKVSDYVDKEVGLLTLNDIMEELDKPGRDPRAEFDLFSFTEGIDTISDLRVDMELPGVVTNVTAFGAFVDVGVHQDGLVHISELSDNFVKDPNEIVKVNQKVNVRITEVDIERNRIAMSMKSKEKSLPKKKNKNIKKVNKPRVDETKNTMGAFFSKSNIDMSKFEKEQPHKKTIKTSEVKKAKAKKVVATFKTTKPKVIPQPKIDRETNRDEDRNINSDNPFADLLK